ncbi:DUF3285 domain-containing protein [Synechococcus sp. PCC 7336]|uniref:DUF3285 domain-containing protein n=1 Tax=Synechococcus sp. PCC 7336 TaxID=195250 RepID=UPI00034CA238|nr:DUF3285 domain-containing protein [Synechococcus sp. PCC 7336]
MSDETAIPEEATESSPSYDPRYMAKPEDSYTKLAMRNMVRRGGTSLLHFGLTITAVLGFLVGMAYLFH